MPSARYLLGQASVATGHQSIGLLCVFDIGLYNNGMETLPGPTIKAGACHSPINNCKHKRTADNCVNPRSIQRSPEMLIAIA